jgi:group 2 family glycosyl transferase
MSNTSVEIVLVLYGVLPEESKAFVSLLRHIGRLRVDYELIVYNNDTSISVPGGDGYIAVNAEKNDMLARAYNFALQKAQAGGRQWLLLLDHDTEPTAEYFETLNRFLNQTTQSPDVVAAVPLLKYGNRIISPEKINPVMWETTPITVAGTYSGNIVAFNSLSLLSTDFVMSIGGFSELYPLDMLDHWLYRQIAVHKKSVEVLDTHISHSLSLLDNSMSYNRLADFLAAEQRFVSTELTMTHYISYKIRLAIRLIKQWIRLRDRRRTQITFKALIGKK